MEQKDLMATKIMGFWANEEVSFAILRALAMIGGMVALFLVPLRPEHQPHLAPLAWSFVAYKLVLFLAIQIWPARLRPILLATVGLDLVFVSLFVWLTGGTESHFYLLYYLLVALAAVHFTPQLALATAGGAGLSYALASVVGTPTVSWHHLGARAATFFLLGGSLGYISQREREARAEAERLNAELEKKQVRLEQAYHELQAAQERLVHSERLATIGRMAAKVSHEVRNPLGSISLNAELLEDELQALPESRRADGFALLAAIRSQIDVLSAVTEEYLRFARLPRPKLEATALAPVIEDLAGFVRGELQRRGVQLVVDIPDGLPTVHVDLGQIRQALLNLIRNAMEAMPDGGTVRVTARLIKGSSRQLVNSSSPIDQSTTGPIDTRDSIEIAVGDTGPGIPPEDLDRIFEPFFTTKDGGTGLGLALARQVAVDHGGRLACESTPGGGTTFRLTLPISDGGPKP